MQNSSLEQLVEKGIVTIQKKSAQYLVELVLKDENGFLVGRETEWGRGLGIVINDLLEKIKKMLDWEILKSNRLGDS